MRRIVPVVLVVVSGALYGCGSSGTPTGPDVGNAAGAIPITGSERLGWSQEGDSVQEVSALRFRLSIDGSAVELTGVTCAPAAADGRFDCSAPLPRMSPGRHVLSLSAVNDSGQDGPASAILVVFLAQS